MAEPQGDRRPLTSRDTKWARWLAGALVKRRVAPNSISVASVFAAALGAAALVCVPEASSTVLRAALYVGAAAMIQLRLCCNLIDGMVAVEGKLGTKTGDVFNELPDRFADLLLIAGAGYAARALPHAIELGWLAASLALITAYVRALGKSVGAGTHFQGPMAKPHRMACLTIACLVAAALSSGPRHAQVIAAALVVIALGTVLTIARRLQRIFAALRAS
ncbi:MAG TPA: CDP-alcohol phosphatidyltransferase family protein [Planctomycetota bacterium]|nr:CDP-alcohol phosphatidyltransferase family protein [Planctomycetota bacterium]